MNKKSLLRWGLTALTIIIIASATTYAYWCHIAYASYDGDSVAWIYVPKNASSDYIRKELTDKAGDAGKNAARLWSWFNGDPSKAHGAYKIEQGTTSLQMFKSISRGSQTPVRLTFNNIRTIDQLASRVASRMEFDSLQFISSMDSILPAKGFKKSTYTAAFLPDTYEFYWTASPAKVINTLLKHRNDFWNEERRAKAKKLGLTPVEIATVASIAEEETNSRQERGTVARLYLNRIHRGMPLQADPTVKFAVGDFSIKRITNAHLNTASPYNTYKFAGLPPGPIRMPESATLDAVLDSKPHNYIYMCAKEDFSGRHNFTSDYVAHQRNASRYRQELNRRNIK